MQLSKHGKVLEHNLMRCPPCLLQVKLAEFSKTPEDFLRKYEELKSKNVRNLDPLVYLLSKLCEDKEVIHLFLQADDRIGFVCCYLIISPHWLFEFEIIVM